MAFDISEHMSGELRAVRETRKTFGAEHTPFHRLGGPGHPELEVAASTINPPELTWRRNPVEWTEERAGLETWSKQREIFRSVVQHPKTAVHSSHSVGKARPLNAVVPTPHGWSTMGELRVGSEVFDESGQVCRVTGVSDVWDLPCYTVTFDDGTEEIVNGEHEWQVLDLRYRLRGVRDWRDKWDHSVTMSTDDLLNEGIRFGGQYRWRIPITRPLDLPSVDLPIAPYVLGAWLGDGTSIRPEISCHEDDREIVDRIADLGENVRRRDKSKYAWVMTGKVPGKSLLCKRLRSLDLLGNKHIPMVYLRASIEQRLELLRGLMDTDGFNQQNSVGIDLCNQKLAYGVAELVRSLGWKVRVRKGPAKLRGVEVGVRYRLAWHPDVNVFGLTRKADRWSPSTGHASRNTIRTIIDIRPVGSVPTICIQVDSPRHLYLAGESMIPTHNSFSAAAVACWWLDVHPPGEAFVLTCYTDDTEVLTQDGWKLFRDVKVGPEGDLFATRRIGSGEFEWQHATRYYRAPWDGEVVDVRCRNMHLRVTGNHRMLTEWSLYKNGERLTGELFKRADAITSRGAQIPALSTWEGKSPETVTFGRYTWATEDFAAFFGAWIAEGSLGVESTRIRGRKYKDNAKWTRAFNGGPIVLTQLPGTKGYEPYRELLIRMLGREPSRSGNSWVFNCKELYYYLREFGKSYEKYIPTDIKDWGSHELDALLRYYLLGDGWSQKYEGIKHTSISWRSCTVSKRLADDLQEIAQKTGRYASITTRPPRDGGTFEDGRRILAENCREGYYLIFGSTRARSVHTARSHYTGNVYCVSVPNETLYVRRGGTPIWCGNTAPTDVQVKAILWREINKLHGRLGLRGRTNLSEWYIGNELVALGRKPSEHNPTGMQGVHARYFLAILDEACGVVKALWDAVSTLAANEFARTLAIGNPDDPQSEFARVCKPDSGWNVLHIGTDDTPNFTGEKVSRSLAEMLPSVAWKEDRKKAWGEDSAIYISKVLGMFPTEDDPYTTIPYVWASRCKYLELPEDGGDVQGGIDVGAGGDRTVIYERRGRVAGRVASFRDSDPMRTIGKLVEKINEWGITKVKVDVIGIGWALYGNLRQSSSRHNPVGAKAGETTHSAEVIPVNFATAPSQIMHKRFLNKRAEVWWNVGREYSRLQSWDLTRVDDDIIAELTAPRYEILDSQGKIKIEAKDAVKKRLGRSPDMADALLLAFYEPGFQASISSGMSGSSSMATTDLLRGLKPL